MCPVVNDRVCIAGIINLKHYDDNYNFICIQATYGFYHSCFDQENTPVTLLGTLLVLKSYIYIIYIVPQLVLVIPTYCQ